MEFKLKDIFSAIIKKWFIILLCTLLSGAVSFTLSKLLIKQQYTATSLVYVDLLSTTGAQNQVTNSGIDAAEKLVSTYIVILQSDSFLEKVSEDCGLTYSASQIKGMVTMGSKDGTQIFSVKVTTDNNQEALAIAQSITKLSKNAIEEAIPAGSVKIIDRPRVTPASSLPAVLKNTLISAFAALILVALIAILGDLLDNRIKSEEDIESHYNIPVLGSVPSIK
ncbi:MAG: hypothetical protein IJF54_00295 [Clostridia bacterium]|nr:hypothetical protein [Clostridia bacterium]